MICVSIGRTRHKMVTAEHRALADRGAGLVELRLDWLARQPDVVRLLRDRPTPVVLTCRRQQDRGRWRGSEDQRLAVLRQAIVEGAEYVDLEEDVAGRVPRYGSTKRIVSHHDFDETPTDVEDVHARLCDLDPDVVKIVTMANRPSDSVRMLQLVAKSKVPTVGFCMGDFGVPSRILCGKFGSPFTYASFSAERELAPGQVPFDEMQSLYRFDDLRRETRVYGVLGDPIGHSLSPLIHNTALRHDGRDAVYLPFRVPKDAFGETIEAFRFLDVDGFSVTIPHKEAAAGLAGERDELVDASGAANTLVRRGDGTWCASNTDTEAALASVRLGLDGPLAGRHALLLGAGGVARAIGAGLVRADVLVTIANRTAKRAAELASELGCRHTAWEHRGTGHPDVIVNCTSLGMHPEVDATPFEPQWFREGTLVFDTVYNPENTLLLKQARERGCRTVSGIEMFVRQAAVQYELFTGAVAPLDVMREALRQGISAVKQ